MSGELSKIRLDKWLWAARFFKTRSLAGDEIDKGRVQVNGQVAKASREVKAGDVLRIRKELNEYGPGTLGGGFNPHAFFRGPAASHPFAPPPSGPRHSSAASGSFASTGGAWPPPIRLQRRSSKGCGVF